MDKCWKQSSLVPRVVPCLLVLVLELASPCWPRPGFPEVSHLLWSNNNKDDPQRREAVYLKPAATTSCVPLLSYCTRNPGTWRRRQKILFFGSFFGVGSDTLFSSFSVLTPSVLVFLFQRLFRWPLFERLLPYLWRLDLVTRYGGSYNIISLFRIAASSFGMKFVSIHRPPCGLHIRLSRVAGWADVMWSILSRL